MHKTLIQNNPAIRWGAHRRHLENTTEPSIAATMRPFCEITLTTCTETHSYIAFLIPFRSLTFYRQHCAQRKSAGI